MTDTEIDAKLAQLRVSHPKMFSHPRARQGEICLGPTIFTMQGASLSAAGLKSVREDFEAVEKVEAKINGRWEKIDGWMIFANAREAVAKGDWSKYKK